MTWTLSSATLDSIVGVYAIGLFNIKANKKNHTVVLTCCSSNYNLLFKGIRPAAKSCWYGLYPCKKISGPWKAFSALAPKDVPF